VAPRSEGPKLITRVNDFDLVQPICSQYRNVTDRQTDGRTTYDSNRALHYMHRAVKIDAHLPKLSQRDYVGVLT